jgi:hypothetical protein
MEKLGICCVAPTTSKLARLPLKKAA